MGPEATTLLHHFSDDPHITRFEPHVPRTNPTHPPAVWAIDAEHAPLYWFPRDCPRVTAWPRTPAEREPFRSVLATAAWRLHAIEIGWLDRVRHARLVRYDLAPTTFTRWPAASGQWISTVPVEPVGVAPVGDLIALHERAGIELRLVPRLGPIADLVRDDRWDFSLVRMANAST